MSAERAGGAFNYRHEGSSVIRRKRADRQTWTGSSGIAEAPPTGTVLKMACRIFNTSLRPAQSYHFKAGLCRMVSKLFSTEKVQR